MSSPILSIQSVFKHYKDKTALSGVTFSVEEGTITGILGPNGAGKTSLIRILTQITAPDSGKILFKGAPISQKDISEFGYLPEERGLYKKMKIMEQIVFFASLKGMKKNAAEKAAIEWLQKLNLYDWRHKKAQDLSKGMQQKVQFIITVIHKPQVIILDEPFSGFDPLNAELIRKEILELRAQGCTLLLSTHRMDSVESLCDSIVLINNSRIVLEGSVKEIRKQYKKNMFKMITEQPLDAMIPDATFVSVATNEYLVTLPPSTSTKVFLSAILNETGITHFEEVLPGMEEIFIEKIKYEQNKSDF